MSGFLFLVLFGLIGLAITTISITIARRQIAAMNVAWQKAAHTLDFTFESGNLSGGPTITGTLEGFGARAHNYTKKAGKSSSRHTRYTVTIPPLGLGLRLMEQAGLGQLLKVFGTQDLEIGDPGFDNAFIVQATDVRAARDFLTPGRTMVLNRLLAVQPRLVVLDDRLLIDHPGREVDPQVVVSTLRRLASAAAVLADPDRSAEMTRTIEQRLGGSLPVDVDGEVSVPDGLDARIARGETLAASGAEGLAGRIFAALATDLPADPEVVGWADYAQAEAPSAPAPTPADPETVDLDTIMPEYTPDLGPQPAYPPAPVAAAVPDDAGPVDENPLGMATDLFGEHRLSFETAARYDEAFAGRSVRWSGKLRRARTVDHDRVLGPGPFDKAVIDVATLENDLFGNTVVSAVVAFPAGTVDGIPPGTDVTFTGRLAGIDAMVRNLFVAGATLTSTATSPAHRTARPGSRPTPTS